MADLAPTIIPIALSIITILETLVLNFKFLNSSHYDDIYKISGIICAVSIGLIGIIIFDNGASLPSDSMPLILGILNFFFFISLPLFMSSLLLKKIQNKSKSTTILATICLTSLGLMVTSIAYFGVINYLNKNEYIISKFDGRIFFSITALNLLMVIATGLATVLSIITHSLINDNIPEKGVVCISVIIGIVFILLFCIIYKFIDKKFSG